MPSNTSTLIEKIESVEAVLDLIDPDSVPTTQSEGLDGRELRRAVEAIIGDLKRLCKADHLTFYFSNGEVEQICQGLDMIATHHATPQHVVAGLNTIRPLIRSYFIRGTAQDRADKIAEVEDKIQNLDDYLAERQALKDVNKALKAELEESKKALEAINTTIEELEGIQTRAEAFESKAKVSADSAETNESEAETSRSTVDAFVKKITQRETELEDQLAKTTAFETKLGKLSAAYDTDKVERDKRLKTKESELNSLIGQAREALELNTSRGLSKEFGERAKSLRPGIGVKFGGKLPFIHLSETGNKALWWMVFAGGFILSAVAITLALAMNLFHLTPDPGGDGGAVDWYHLTGRLSAVGLFVTAAVFCAAQYKRTQRLLEDYTYKKVVAASLPAFLEKMDEIKDEDSAKAKLLTKALDEIHRHPLQVEEKAKAQGNAETSPLDLEKLTELVKAFKEV